VQLLFRGIGLSRLGDRGARVRNLQPWVASYGHTFAAELQRDWAREQTAADLVEIVLTERLLKT
jgi:hypothetical protein